MASPTINTPTVQGHQVATFEGGHRVPFIFHWPAKIKERMESEVRIHAMDLFLPCRKLWSQVTSGSDFRRGKLTSFVRRQNPNQKSPPPFLLLQLRICRPSAKALGNSIFHAISNNFHSGTRTRCFSKGSTGSLQPCGRSSRNHERGRKHPEVVQRMVALAKEKRAELGEYLKRGKGQRPTGSVIRSADCQPRKRLGKLVARNRIGHCAERLKRHEPSQKKTKLSRKALSPPAGFQQTSFCRKLFS